MVFIVCELLNKIYIEITAVVNALLIYCILIIIKKLLCCLIPHKYDYGSDYNPLLIHIIDNTFQIAAAASSGAKRLNAIG